MRIEKIACDYCTKEITFENTIKVQKGLKDHHDPMRGDIPIYEDVDICDSCCRIELRRLLSNVVQVTRDQFLKNRDNQLKRTVNKGEEKVALQ